VPELRIYNFGPELFAKLHVTSCDLGAASTGSAFDEECHEFRLERKWAEQVLEACP
jgi:hypothetical protein